VFLQYLQAIRQTELVTLVYNKKNDDKFDYLTKGHIQIADEIVSLKERLIAVK
jgi:hypothetical protein